MNSIDLNADLGEGEPDDEALMQIVSSCNIACGGHAGDALSMATTVRLALENGVAVGAHPSYPDRDGFGRRKRFLAGDALYASLSDQVAALADIAAELGASIGHVKAHGALYNDAADDEALANIVARVAVETPGHCALVGLPDSEIERAALRHGLVFVAEAFIDRAYSTDGRLVARTEPGAVHEEIETIIEQAVSLACDKRVRSMQGKVIRVAADTLCIHGDTPGADEAARAVRDALERHGVQIRRAGSQHHRE